MKVLSFLPLRREKVKTKGKTVNIRFNGEKVQAIDVTPLEMLKLNFGLTKELDVAEKEFDDYGWAFFRVICGEDAERSRKEYETIRRKLAKSKRSVPTFDEAVGGDGCIEYRGPYALMKGKGRGRRTMRVISVEEV